MRKETINTSTRDTKFLVNDQGKTHYGENIFKLFFY